jgi:hypothetical protein
MSNILSALVFPMLWVKFAGNFFVNMLGVWLTSAAELA